MQIQADELKQALKAVSRIIPKKPTLPVTTHVLLQNGYLCATDLAIAYKMPLEGALERIAVPHKLLLEWLDYVATGETVVITRKGDDKVTAQAGRMTTTLSVEDHEDFPPIPTVKKPARFSIEGTKLVAAIDEIRNYCAGGNDVRKTLTGVYLEFRKDSVAVAAADGFRLAWRNVPLTRPLDFEGVDDWIEKSENHMVLPHGSATFLVSVWGKNAQHDYSGFDIAEALMAPKVMQVEIGKEFALFKIGAAEMTTELIEGQFPNYTRLIPDDLGHKISFLSDDLRAALNQVCGALKPTYVSIGWEGTEMTVSATADKLGEASATVPLAEGDVSGKIQLAPGPLTEYLKDKRGLVTMLSSEPSKPVVLRHYSDPEVILMPMLVSVVEPKQPAAEKKEQKQQPSDKTGPKQQEAANPAAAKKKETPKASKPNKKTKGK